jgi:hypothetical protein
MSMETEVHADDQGHGQLAEHEDIHGDMET